MIQSFASCVKEVAELPSTRPPKGATYEATKDMLIREKLSLAKIASKRAMTVGTIISHIERLLEEGQLDAEHDLAKLKPTAKKFEAIKKALFTVRAREGEMYLSQTREILGDEYTFDDIRLARLFFK